MAERLDVYLAKTGRFKSRTKAAEAIESGQVRLNGKLAKPSDKVNESDNIDIEAHEEYVGRGAYKLLAAAERYGICFFNRTCIDVGASTGGFTEVMLKLGAAKVYAVDVGSGQLAEVLVCDKRVKNLENTDVRTLEVSRLDIRPDFFTIDVSFISLSLVIPSVRALMAEKYEGVVLIKPQFEAGRKYVGKNGIVKDPASRRLALENAAAVFNENNMIFAGMMQSPITGGDGNIEYLAYLKSEGESLDIGKAIKDIFTGR